MKCGNCGSEWQPPKTVQILFCPFCHNPLITVGEKFVDLDNVLLYLTRQYGAEILLNKITTLQFIEYYLPEKKREYNFMNMAYAANVIDILFKSKNLSEAIQRNVIKQSTMQLRDKYGVADDWAEYVVGSICNCLEITNCFEQSVIKIIQRAEGSDVDAQYELAERYYLGKGVVRNIGKYIFWLQCASENGSYDAKFQLGKELYQGRYCKKDETNGKELMLQAALTMNPDAICFLACKIKELGLNESIIGELVTGLENSGRILTVRQLLNLAVYYSIDTLLSYDLRKAIDFARRAYEQDEKLAWETYVSLLRIENTSEHAALALRVLRETAVNGCSNAAKILGKQYEDAAKTENDTMTAIYWYRMAADAGDVDTQVHLAEIYEQGLGIEKDLEKAIYWYRIAAYHGSEAAHRKVSYKSKDCIVRELTLVYEDDTEEVFHVKASFGYCENDYLIIQSPQTDKEMVVSYSENRTIDGFEVGEVDEQTKTIVLKAFYGR